MKTKPLNSVSAASPFDKVLNFLGIYIMSAYYRSLSVLATYSNEMQMVLPQRLVAWDLCRNLGPLSALPYVFMQMNLQR